MCRHYAFFYFGTAYRHKTTSTLYTLGPPAATYQFPAANTVGGLFKGERGEIGQSNAGWRYLSY